MNSAPHCSACTLRTSRPSFDRITATPLFRVHLNNGFKLPHLLGDNLDIVHAVVDEGVAEKSFVAEQLPHTCDQ